MENYSEYLILDFEEKSCSAKVMTDLQVAECGDDVIRWANNTFEVNIAAAVGRDKYGNAVTVKLRWVALSAIDSETRDKLNAFLVEEMAID